MNFKDLEGKGVVLEQTLRGEEGKNPMLIPLVFKFHYNKVSFFSILEIFDKKTDFMSPCNQKQGAVLADMSCC